MGTMTYTAFRVALSIISVGLLTVGGGLATDNERIGDTGFAILGIGGTLLLLTLFYTMWFED